ncbi:MAG TPA: D-alanine--D-alanine ligase [Candidatus Paceibacterota bacterium]|nr:D-alanine--D-alanine ligase [Candidatus Paceibacterota bacterium]
MQTVVGVLRGGVSSEHEVSLRSGATMLANLSPERYDARDIYIDKQGVWHDRGKPSTPERILRQIDVALLPLHGEYGENGDLQRLLERFSVPYAGADSFHAYLAMHKLMAKMKAKEHGVATPDFRYVESGTGADDIVREVVRSFLQPVVVKPVDSGSSVGVQMAAGFSPILDAVQAIFAQGSRGVLIEERIRGKEATVGVVDDLRGQAQYALPVIEIVPPENDFFSYESKYNGASQEIVPGRFSRVETEELQRLAKVMHRALGQRHYSRSDFMVTPRKIYYLETNSAAAVGMTSESLLPKALAAVGIPLANFLEHVIGLARA